MVVGSWGMDGPDLIGGPAISETENLEVGFWKERRVIVDGLSGRSRGRVL